MSAGVYSVRFVELHNYTGIYVVKNEGPSTWVLRDLDAYSGAVIDEGTLFLRGNANNVLFYATSSIAAGSYVSWRGRQIIGPGESFAIEADVNGWDVAVSGYQLVPGPGV